MSRMPPVPSASRPAYGPDAVPKDFITDLSHHTDLPFEQRQPRSGTVGQNSGSVDAPSQRHRNEPARSGDDLGGMVARHGRGDGPWMVIGFGVVVAAIVWLANRQSRIAA